MQQAKQNPFQAKAVAVNELLKAIRDCQNHLHRQKQDLYIMRSGENNGESVSHDSETKLINLELELEKLNMQRRIIMEVTR